MKHKRKTLGAGLALSLLCIGIAPASFGWGVDVTTKIGSQEAGRDAHKNSYNRYGSHNVAGSADFSKHVGSSEAGRDLKQNSQEIGGNVSHSNVGNIRLGNKDIDFGTTRNDQDGKMSSFGNGSRTSSGSVSSRMAGESGVDDGARAFQYGRSGAVRGGDTDARQTNYSKFASQSGSTFSGSDNHFDASVTNNQTFGNVTINGESE